MRFDKNSEISKNWPFFIGWWRHDDVNGRYFWHSKHSRDILLSCCHFELITDRLRKMVQCTKFWYEKCNFWYLTHFQWPVTSWWRNLSDIFYIHSIPEMLYYHLDTLVTGYCVPCLHVKQTRIGVDKCFWIGNFPLLISYNTLKNVPKIENFSAPSCAI